MADTLQKIIRDYLTDYCQTHEESLPHGRFHELVMAQAEKPLIECALKCCDGNQSKTAALLGINRNTLHKKMQHYDLLEPSPGAVRLKRRRAA